MHIITSRFYIPLHFPDLIPPEPVLPPSILQIITTLPFCHFSAFILAHSTVKWVATQSADYLPGKIILTGIASFSIDSAFVALLSSVIQPLIRPLKQICINNSRYDVFMYDPLCLRVLIDPLALKIIMLSVLDDCPLVDRVSDNISDQRRAYHLSASVTIAIPIENLCAAVCSVTVS